MRAPATSELLDAWDAGERRGGSERAVLLLETVWPDTDSEALLDMSLGERDRELLAIREMLFGSDLLGSGNCPNCSEQFEVSFSTSDVSVDRSHEFEAALELHVGDYEIACRPPTTRDLLAVAEAMNEDQARAGLLSCCIPRSDLKGAAVRVDELPAEVTEAVAKALESANPQAEVELLVTCDACGHNWTAPFDIAHFLWSELDIWARQTLREVAWLARAYGWSETDILRLPAPRRRHYLKLAYSA